MTPKLSWDDAIIRVLTEADEPTHYRDITDEILVRELVATVGKTPSATVRSAIYRMIKSGKSIESPAPGVFRLPGIKGGQTATVQVDDNESIASEDPAQNLSVAAYGLHWERHKVNWSNGRILGYDTDPKQAIDFSNQQGVYLLHNWQSIVYVGRTDAEKSGLLQRLRHHHRRSDWSGKWERFSWFGVRQVDDQGNMIDGPDIATKEIVVALMETLLIEVLGPALNRNQGDYLGNLYRQATDPDIAREQALEMLRKV